MFDIDVYLFIAIDCIHEKRWDLVKNVFEVIVIEWGELFEIVAEDLLEDFVYFWGGYLLVWLDWIGLVRLDEFFELFADYLWHWVG